MEASNVPSVTPQPQQVQPEVTTKSNLPIIIVVVLIVAALLLGGYIVMSGQGGQDQYTAVPTPSPTASSDLEDDLSALDVESNDTEFEDVDRDLQSL